MVSGSFMSEIETPRRKVHRLSFGYDFRIAEVRREVGQRVKLYLEESDMSVRAFADSCFLQLGYESAGDAYNKLICIRSGRKAGENYKESRGFRFDERELDRLYRLLGKIGAEQPDSLIDKLKGVEPRFKYELEPETKKRVLLSEYKKTGRAMKVTGVFKR